MNPDTDMRTHVILPRAVVETIDQLVGQRGRSRFLAEAAQRELAHRQMLEIAQQALGSGKDLDRPWGRTPESIAAWIEETRDGTLRDEQLEAQRRGT